MSLTSMYSPLAAFQTALSRSVNDRQVSHMSAATTATAARTPKRIGFHPRLMFLETLPEREIAFDFPKSVGSTRRATCRC